MAPRNFKPLPEDAPAGSTAPTPETDATAREIVEQEAPAQPVAHDEAVVVPKKEPESVVARAPTSIAGTPGRGGVYRMVDGQRVKINRR